MRKILIGLCMIVLVLIPAGALAAEGDAIIAREDYSSNVFVMDDTLYMVQDDAICTYRVGDADLTEYAWDPVPESLEQGEGYNYGSAVVFADGGQIRAFEFIMKYDESGSQISRVLLSTLELKDGQVARTESQEVAWPEELVESYSAQEQYPKSMQNVFVNDGKLFCMTYGNTGEEIYALDLETMKISRIESEYVQAMLPYTDGGLLLVNYDYNAQSAQMEVCDPETGSRTQLAKLGEMNSISGFAADPQTGDVYGVVDGDICQIDLATGEPGEALTEMPMAVYSNQSGLILSGQYYVYSTYEGTVIRNMRPEHRPETRLKVYDGNWTDAVTDAYFQFTNAHGDVAVSLTRDYQNQTNLIEDMMNRSSNVDVYMLNMDYSAYNALLERGFMAELDESEKLTALVGSMYPSVQKALMRGDHVVAMPVQAYGQAMGVNERVLEVLGLTIEDVPTNWMDFLDFVANDLPPRMAEHPEVSLFYNGMTQRDMRYQLFYTIFEAYQTYANETMDVVSFDTDVMRTLLEKLSRIDFTALGAAEDPEDPEMTGAISFSSDSMMLFETGSTVTFGNYYSESTPLMMSIDADRPAYLPLSMVVAFVNPFSENVEMSIAFVEQLADCLPESLWYNFCPDRTEPLRRKNWEEDVEGAQKYYDSLMESYEKAEEADKQAMEESIAYAKDWIERAKENSWEVSQEQIDWYHGLEENIVASGYNWLYQDDSGEAYEAIMQYMDGKIDARQFLQSIDKKIRMMQMEGY